MPGGTWTAQNKVRPGAYINFTSVPKPSSSVGERGIMTMALPMSWGPVDTLIPLYSTDLLDGKSLNKVGVTAFDAASLPFREALSYAYLCLVFRLDAGGVRATASIPPLAATAKYAGTLGNQLSVAVQQSKADATRMDVITYLNGAEKDRQTAANTEELTPNDWVEFAGEGPLVASAGVMLAEGEDGTVSPERFTAYFNAIAPQQWNAMALLSDNAQVQTQAVQFIKQQRDGVGRKRQLVLHGANTTDYEGVIVTTQGYVNQGGERIEPAQFPITAASMTAAARVNQSNTYKVVLNAAEIIGPLADEEIVEALQGGLFVLSTRQDGVIVVEQDINSFVSFETTKAREFSKNRVIRCLDDINNVIVLKFERGYIGRVDNNAIGRNVFKADIIGYLTELETMGAIQNFDPAADITVEQGQEIEGVVADLWIQPVDAMEKLYMSVYVR